MFYKIHIYSYETFNISIYKELYIVKDRAFSADWMIRF